jgi:hypothetical protein
MFLIKLFLSNLAMQVKIADVYNDIMLKMGTKGPSVPDARQFWAIRASLEIRPTGRAILLHHLVVAWWYSSVVP